MKTIKIGDETFYLATGTDINYLRSVAFDNYFRQILEDINDYNFAVLHEKIKRAIDKGQLATIAVLMQDFAISLKLMSADADAYGLCFALICSEKDEDLSNTDETFLKEKLNKFSKLGLSKQDVKREVENFIKAFPFRYSVYKLRAEGLTIN